ncbi:MAG: acyl-CoA dehydrogenase family protein [Iamia sp.]
MDLHFSAADEAFRAEARGWLTEALNGEFSVVKGRGGPGDEHSLFEQRWAWEQHLGAHGWTALSWPVTHGGRDLSLHQQVIWYEEYARAQGPGRLGHIGEGLVGPTVLHFGDDAQRARFLPGIQKGTELWCQGYSEPNAGSDLANISTRAERDGDDWVLSGQKVWTSLAQWSQWCFVLARTNKDVPTAGSPKHKGITFFMVPMDQDGIEIRPIRQVTGTAEFNEVFFDGARAAHADVIGGVDEGWKVAMGLLAFERGASTLGQQLAFRNELDGVIDTLRRNGRMSEPTLRQRVAQLHAELEIMGWNSLRVLSESADDVPREALITKLYWASWHRALGELAVDAAGADALVGLELDHPEPGDELTDAQRLFLFTRSDTIYGGSNEIQRNIIGERGLGLPREPRP